MDSTEFTAAIGKPEESPQVQQLLTAIGWTKKLKMPNDDIDVRAAAPNLGVTMIFEPEAPKSSRLIFSAVQFISDAEKGHKRFGGKLPAKLTFSDLKAEAIAKLGSPEDDDDDMRLTIWRFGGLKLAIDFAVKEPHPVGVITVQLPPKS
jgi:hypothetical protein